MRDRITLRFLAAPTDETRDGTSIQAGRVLEWIDKAGYACATGYSGTSVTKSMSSSIRPSSAGDRSL